MLRASAIAAVLITISAGTAFAQEATMVPLADVARQAEAAKATVKKAKKTYTNSDLGKDPRGEPVAAPSTGLLSKGLDKSVTPEEVVAQSEAKPEAEAIAQESEESWRARAGGARKQVERMAARLTDLTTSNASRSENAEVRARNASEISNTRTALESMRKQWDRLEASARERKIPIAWIQPAPVFPQ